MVASSEGEGEDDQFSGSWKQIAIRLKVTGKLTKVRDYREYRYVAMHLESIEPSGIRKEQGKFELREFKNDNCNQYGIEQQRQMTRSME